jgi:2-oxoglutarate dehydrogenase E2 component (dihydrolipoamide succinyltransferase)
MIIEIKIPSPGESITEVEIASWLIQDGDFVEKDQEIAEVESDKATLPLIAEKGGKIKIIISSGKKIKVGSVACTIDTSVEMPSDEKKAIQAKLLIKDPAEKIVENSKNISKSSSVAMTEGEDISKQIQSKPEDEDTKNIKVTPLARKVMDENNLNVEDIIKGLKKITTREVNTALENITVNARGITPGTASRNYSRERMSSLRRKISQRLVSAKNETAMLTTFNEVDMSRIIELRKNYQDQFTKKHGVKLGFMSFFTKAVTEALILFPRVNSQIEGEEIITPEFADIAIAVQTDKGLMVPVLRNTEVMSFADIEKKIAELAQKARSFRLSIEEMTGGTFTITNGGIYGSMLSTPILNQPQSAILGMHNIIERPVAIKGQVEIRPMMYLAVSYDHRIIDGRDSVSFLAKVKELIENPAELLFNGQDPEKILLGI